MVPLHSKLPDYLAPGLSILFVGINPGLRSAEVGHHFAGHSNRFWKLLFESDLIPSPMTYREDKRLLDYGYGFTNLVAKPTAGLHNVSREDFLQGRRALIAKIRKYQPVVVALLGISVARAFFPLVQGPNSKSPMKVNSIQPGLQPEFLEGTRFFVLPNPSGRNAHYTFQHMHDLFCQLKNISLQFSSPV